MESQWLVKFCDGHAVIISRKISGTLKRLISPLTLMSNLTYMVVVGLFQPGSTYLMGKSRIEFPPSRYLDTCVNELGGNYLSCGNCTQLYFMMGNVVSQNRSMYLSMDPLLCQG